MLNVEDPHRTARRGGWRLAGLQRRLILRCCRCEVDRCGEGALPRKGNNRVVILSSRFKAALMGVRPIGISLDSWVSLIEALGRIPSMVTLSAMTRYATSSSDSPGPAGRRLKATTEACRLVAGRLPVVRRRSQALVAHE